MKQILLEVLARLTLRLVVAGRDAGIVDQYANTLLLRLDLLHSLVDGVFVRHIALQRNDLAFGTLSVGIRRILERLKTTAQDVDFGTVCSQGLCGHETNTGPSTRDDSNYEASATHKYMCMSIDRLIGRCVSRHAGRHTGRYSRDRTHTHLAC